MFQRNPDEFLSIHYCERNMDPLFHTWEGTVKTMDFTGWTSSEEEENRKVSRKGDGHSFFRMTTV